MAFHSHHNWFWERLQDGSVRIVRRNVVGTTVEEHVLTPNAWASIVASMSLRGETGETVQQALAWHMKPNT